MNVTHLKNSLRHPLISGSFIMFIGANAANFFSFLFSIFIARNLSIVNYGVVASLMSFFALVTIPAGAMVPTVVRFAASYFAHSEYGKVRTLFIRLGIFSLIIGVFILVSSLVFSSYVERFFHIHDTSLIVLVGLLVFLSYIGTVNTGLLQAKLAFLSSSLLSIAGTALKLLFGIIFLLLGYSVKGVMWAYILSFLITILISFYPLRIVLKNVHMDNRVNIGEIFSFGAPAAIIFLGFTAFINTDILLVKHFFNPQTAGLYAGLSLVGKIIFFVTAPISTVMFPLIVQKHTKKERYNKLFFMSLLLTLLPAVIIMAGNILFPQFVISVLFKNHEYLRMYPLLWLFSLFIVIYSLLNVMINFFLSIKKTGIYLPIVISAFCQVLLLWFFHQSLAQVIFISMGITTLLLISLILYYIKLYAQEKRN